MKKSNHGGRREGSGRKAGVKTADTVQMLIRPLAATAKRLRDRARAENKTPGQIIDELI